MISERLTTWLSNRIIFGVELEKFLSHCPNMVDEDDKRDICASTGMCPFYECCISIEPSESYLEVKDDDEA